MDATRSWHFLGGPGSWSYRFFDARRKRLNGQLAQYLLAKGIPRAASRVLEAGSGPGHASSLLAAQRKVRLSVAADIDLEALREARRLDPALPIVVADLHHLPFRSGAFDLTWNSSTLEHVGFPGGAVGEMERVVKNGGYVFVGVPYRFGPLGFQPWIRETRLGVWIGSVFDRPRLVRMMVERGLTPVATITYFFRCFIGVLARKPADGAFPESEALKRAQLEGRPMSPMGSSLGR